MERHDQLTQMALPAPHLSLFIGRNEVWRSQTLGKKPVVGQQECSTHKGIKLAS